MIISLDTAGGLQVEDPLNFKAFSFRADAGRRPADSEAVTFDGTSAWVSEPHLRAWAPLADNPDWQRGLDSMIEFARSRGWVHPDTGRIEAHVEGA